MSIAPEHAIRTTLLEMIADIKENIVSSPADIGDMLMITYFFEKMDSKTLLDRVVNGILPYKKQIMDHDVSFFIDQREVVFKGLPKDRIEHFSQMLSGSSVSEENREVIFLYFEKLIEIASKFKRTC